MDMKKMFRVILVMTTLYLFAACNVFKKPKEGCPSNGKNVGAEKLLGGSTEKIPKARKFRD
jgi:hypothetical protein